MLIRNGLITYNTDCLDNDTIYLLVEGAGFKEVKEKKKPSKKEDQKVSS